MSVPRRRGDVPPQSDLFAPPHPEPEDTERDDEDELQRYARKVLAERKLRRKESEHD